MTNLTTATAAELVTRLARLETAVRHADARSPEATHLADLWEKTRQELDSRPLATLGLRDIAVREHGKLVAEQAAHR